MKSELVVNISPFANRMAFLENNKLVELFIHREDQNEIVGNIYKGIVKDNVPGMGASFIDIGLERTALLHFRDAVPDFMDLEEIDDSSLKEIKNDIYKMGELLESGQEVMVEVEKAPIAKKGARLTGEISIPGRFMVYMPNKNYIAISRKISSSKEKRRLKHIFSDLKEKNVGLIVRTFAEYHTEQEFKKEYRNLKKTWHEIQQKFKDSPNPTCIYNDNDLTSTIIRDLIHKNIDKVIIDSKKVRANIIKRLKLIAPDLIKKIRLYREDANIFDAYGIEKELSKIFRSRIYLDSGGFIVIQQTEALVSIDVNTGSFVGNKSLENTVTLTNIEAAKEVARQIRLQDLTGMIFIDFIDMYKPENRLKLLQTFREEMGKDYCPNKIFSSSPLNMVEMTRKRAKSNMLSNFYEQCPSCQSTGRVLSRISILDNIFRWMDRAAKYHSKDELEIHIHPWVYEYILEKKPIIKAEYPFTWKFSLDGEMGITDYKIISSKSKKDITDLYQV